MKEVIDFVRANGHLIAAVIAGTCALTAAYIRRDRRWERTESGVPVFSLLMTPVIFILIGIGCLSAEFFVYNIESRPDLSDPGLSDPGTLLALAGCVMIAAGLLWGPYNLYRLATWPRPPEAPPGEEPPPSVPLPTPPSK
jgi:uncharacterized membrane protein